MRRSAAAAAAVIVPLLAVPLVPTASAASAAPAAPYKGANTAAVQDDFNGDGYRDLAVGAPGSSPGGVQGAGSVSVLYGSASSVSSKHRQIISQDSPGIPGTSEEWDAFGSAVASADLDRDGYADLLVGIPNESVGDKSQRGYVTIVWGGPGGLSGGAGVPVPAGFGNGQQWCSLGMSLATGDMNGDGAPEVSLGSLCDPVAYVGPFSRTGTAASSYLEWRAGVGRSMVMGDVNGDGKAERFWLPGPTTSDLRGPVRLDEGPPIDGTLDNMPVKLPYADGWHGEIGDVNGDGYGDLVTAVPEDESVTKEPGSAYRGGQIDVLYGSAQGITPDQKPQVFTQDTAGVPGTAEDGDEFGHSLSVGDVDGDGYADVLVGVPMESVGKVAAAGMAVLLHGSAAGLTTAKATSWTQDTAGVPGGAEAGDVFGWAVRLADLNRDGKAETVVGVPGENDDGCVWTARGSASGPVVSGSLNVGGGVTVGDVSADFGSAMTSAISPY